MSAQWPELASKQALDPYASVKPQQPRLNAPRRGVEVLQETREGRGRRTEQGSRVNGA